MFRESETKFPATKPAYDGLLSLENYFKHVKILHVLKGIFLLEERVTMLISFIFKLLFFKSFYF